MCNNKDVEKYISFRRNVEGLVRDTTLQKHEILLKHLGKVLNKPFKQAIEIDFAKYLKGYKDTTRNNKLTVITPFYRWLYKSDKTPNCLKNFKLKSINKIYQERAMIYRQRVISEVEYHKMLDVANARDRAIIETLFYTAVREGEMVSMKSDGVIYEDGITSFIVYKSKIQPREVNCKGRLEHLLKYVNHYQPNRGKKGLPLWVGYKETGLTESGVFQVIKRLTAKAGLRHITVHDFRHTALTRARAEGIPETFIDDNSGLVKGSNMLKVYDHNSTSDFKKWLREGNGSVEPTNEILKKQKQRLEEKHSKEIERLNAKVEKMDMLQYQMDQLQEYIRHPERWQPHTDKNGMTWERVKPALL